MSEILAYPKNIDRLGIKVMYIQRVNIEFLFYASSLQSVITLVLGAIFFL